MDDICTLPKVGSRHNVGGQIWIVEMVVPGQQRNGLFDFTEVVLACHEQDEPQTTHLAVTSDGVYMIPSESNSEDLASVPAGKEWMTIFA